MRPRYEYGSEVRVTRNVRNDGTYPGKEIGEMLVRRGATGCVYDVGTYLQDQLIYRVHFLNENKTIGCREEELIPADAPWVESVFEYGDKITAKVDIPMKGKIVAKEGDKGEIRKVLRDIPSGVQYHVHFGDGHIYQIPEPLIQAAE